MLTYDQDVAEFFNPTRYLLRPLYEYEYFLKPRSIQECCHDVASAVLNNQYKIVDIDCDIRTDFDCDRLLRFKTWIIMPDQKAQHWINYRLDKITDYSPEIKQEFKNNLYKYEDLVRRLILNQYRATNDNETK